MPHHWSFASARAARACRYIANMQYCQFPRLARGLAEAGISSFRWGSTLGRGPMQHAPQCGGRAQSAGELGGGGATVACPLCALL